MIKKRTAKISRRGIYLQDRELRETKFEVGTHYKYIIGEGKIFIVPSTDEKDNVVSKRQLKDGLKPVIDIRNKEALEVFKGSDYLQVSIFEDKILVEGYEKSEEKSNESIGSKLQKKCKKFFQKDNVLDITNLISVKKKAQIVLSKEQFQKVVGIEGLGQITISEHLSQSISSSNVVDLKEKLKDLIIPLQVASFFSGAGILDTGFFEAGYDVVFALELDRAACQTYQYNTGHNILCADIKEVSDDLIPKAPVMVGGPPCKPFTKENQIKRLEEHQDSELVLEYIKKIKANKNCKVFVIENTPELITAANGKYLNMILENLSEFEISYDILSDKDMQGSQSITDGIQDRKRAIVVGSKIGKIDLPEAEEREGLFGTVGEALTGITEDIPNQKDVSISSEEVVQRMSYVPQGGNFKNIPVELRTKATHSNSYKRLHPDKKSITLVNYRKPVIINPYKDSTLTGLEAKRITKMPDYYDFKGNLSDIQQQIGNGVPTSLAYQVANVIKKAIEKWNVRYNLSYQGV